MRTAVLADIHGNREALEACLAHARRQGVDGFAILGDIVGYGADPIACIDRVRELAAAGAPVVQGNHDAAALGGLWADMNDVAREATYWTRARLDTAEKEFLALLPLTATLGDWLLVHASAAEPAAWGYIDGERAARRSIDAAEFPGTFCGHVHLPMFYFTASAGARSFSPRPGVPFSLPRRRWLALVGSVGKPRDGNPAAAYVLADDQRRQLCYFRVPYDHRATARKIIAAGLPEELASRLEQGL